MSSLELISVDGLMHVLGDEVLMDGGFLLGPLSDFLLFFEEVLVVMGIGSWTLPFPLTVPFSGVGEREVGRWRMTGRALSFDGPFPSEGDTPMISVVECSILYGAGRFNVKGGSDPGAVPGVAVADAVAFAAPAVSGADAAPVELAFASFSAFPCFTSSGESVGVSVIFLWGCYC